MSSATISTNASKRPPEQPIDCKKAIKKATIALGAFGVAWAIIDPSSALGYLGTTVSGAVGAVFVDTMGRKIYKKLYPTKPSNKFPEALIGHTITFLPLNDLAKIAHASKESVWSVLARDVLRQIYNFSPETGVCRTWVCKQICPPDEIIQAIGSEERFLQIPKINFHEHCYNMIYSDLNHPIVRGRDQDDKPFIALHCPLHVLSFLHGFLGWSPNTVLIFYPDGNSKHSRFREDWWIATNFSSGSGRTSRGLQNNPHNLSILKTVCKGEDV